MIFLSDLLAAKDFKSATDELAREFRKRHGLPALHQLGLVVASAEAAARELEGRGLGPFFMASGQPVIWRERGEERTFRGKMGLAYHHGRELELLEPGQGSDFYRQHLDAAGKIVVQHLGFLAPEVDEWAGKLEKQGVPVVVRGRLKSGPLCTDFVYLDTMRELGIIIEFISWKVFGRLITPSAGLAHSLGRLQKWTGKRSWSL